MMKLGIVLLSNLKKSFFLMTILKNPHQYLILLELLDNISRFLSSGNLSICFIVGLWIIIWIRKHEFF